MLTQAPEAISLNDLGGFLDKQEVAWKASCEHQYLLYGGTRGCAKSHFLRWAAVRELILLAARGVRNAVGGLFTVSYPTLKDRQISKIAVEFPEWLGTLKETKEYGLGFILYEEYGGGVIALRNLDDIRKYQSAEFAFIHVDELTEITKETFDRLRGSLRWPGVKKPRFRATANPGGIGHGWVSDLWINRRFTPELQPFADEFIYVPGSPYDNPYLSADYWDMLKSLPPLLRRAWLEGDWSVFQGQAFADFQPERHVIPPDKIPAGGAIVSEIPAHWPRRRAVDWGYAEPFCCLWAAIDPDTGRVIVYREAYQTGLIDRQQARLIKELSGDEDIRITYADPSMWTRRTVGTQVSTSADEYRRNGVPLTRADNSRVSGWRKIHQALAPLPDGLPGLLVVESCKNLIRTLPTLAADDNNPEDIADEQEDHAADALRYLFTMRPGHVAKPATRVPGRLEGLRNL